MVDDKMDADFAHLT